jgi:serine phosphatase RsbU (regulator of sigma subunit)
VLLRARGFLAPPERPEVPGAEYAWDLWRGQYPGNAMLDALALPNRSLGLLLAEAEGSDLEAAIRLIQLQALLRSRFWAYGDDLRELLESTERALLAARNESRPLRLFCARYRPLTRTLHYVNAGYYAPMLLRVHAKGADIMRLSSRSGPLCDPSRPVLVEEEIDLQQGDLLAIASPGVAATRSPQKEIWGENRLADTLLSWEGQPVQEIARLTLRTAEEFSARDPQQPARTLVLLRLQQPEHAPEPTA